MKVIKVCPICSIQFTPTVNSVKEQMKRPYCSRKCAGIAKSQIYRKEKSPQWKGMDAGYMAKHRWIYKNYGKASICEICGTKVASIYHWSNISGLYLREVSDYRQLCPSCHKIVDGKQTCKHGHPLSGDNIRKATKGNDRRCITCEKMYTRRYLDKLKQKNYVQTS